MLINSEKGVKNVSGKGYYFILGLMMPVIGYLATKMGLVQEGNGEYTEINY